MKALSKMKWWHSIKVKLFAMICMIAAAFIAILTILNLFCYRDYYLYERKNALSKIYHAISAQYTGELSSITDRLEQIENRAAVRISIVNDQGQMVYDSFYREHREEDIDERVPFEMYDMYMTHIALDEAKETEMSRQGYSIVLIKTKEPTPKETEEFLCLIGELNAAQELLIIRIPMAYMEQNKSFNMTFLMISSGVSLILCIGLGYFLSKQFTRPLIEMEEIATAMAELDFSKIYTGHAHDEIGRLGNSINRLSEHLETAIVDLQRTNEELAHEIAAKERIDNMRQEFIVNVSHELKTPIALIQGYAEGLRVGVTDNEEDREYYCDIIVDEAHRMNHLVMQLLDLSKLELGKETPEPSEVDLYPLCRSVVEKLTVLRQERQQSIDYELCKAQMYADYGMIEQVLTNYLSNAIRYTPENGKIKVSAQTSADGAVTLFVDNEGEPIAESDLTMIFEKFYRTDKARSRESGGTGIGLSIVRAIAEAHNGNCGAENLKNGVRFWFTVPANTKQETQE